MSKVHLYNDEDTTYYCSQCKSLAIDKVVVRNPITRTDDVIWKCNKCGCTSIESVSKFEDYLKICDEENINYIKKKEHKFNF